LLKNSKFTKSNLLFRINFTNFNYCCV